MAMAPRPGGSDYLPHLPLDQAVPPSVLARRNAVSFCSTSSYITVPRLGRRGGISYEKTDKNAVYVRALGDGRMRGRADRHDAEVLEAERKMIEKLTLPDYKLRFRSRFLSLHKVHRRRRPLLRLSLTQDNKQVLDDYYHRNTQKLLCRVHSWNFNIFHLDTLTGGRSLLHLAYHLFREYGFLQCFQLDIIKLLRFFTSIEENYHDSNPYHNVVHAADVAQAMHCYLMETKMREVVTPLEAMMSLISSLTHDLDHPGVNQTFLIATSNHLANLYQNTSVLEMHHWRCAEGLIRESGIFSHFSKSQWASAIWQLRSLILATDITRQQEFLIKFRRLLDNRKEFDYKTNSTTRNFVLQIALKCADICNPCRTWNLSKVWSERVCEEFFHQGDLERALGIPVTPLCDRENNTIPKIQIGFMSFVVRPLFMEWQRFLPTELSQLMLDNIEENKAHWEATSERDANASNLATVETDSSSSRADSTQGRGQDTNRNNSGGVGEEEEEGEMEEGEEDQVSSEGHGEEQDVVENNVNLAFHYQTDSEQQSDSSSRALLPISEDEQLALLARNSRRRHSMPVVVRKDLSFYLGLRRDSFPRSNFLRRQSLPATPLYLSPASALGREGSNGKRLSVEGLTWRPKISSLSSMEGCFDHLDFVPLANQTHLLQHGGWGANSNAHPHRQSASCVELRRRSQQLKEDAEKLKAVLGRMVKGDGLQHPELVGLASSWPSILRAGQKVVRDDLKMLLSSPDTEAMTDSDPPSVTDSVGSSSNTTTTNSNNNNVACLSTPQPEGVTLLSRPH